MIKYFKLHYFINIGLAFNFKWKSNYYLYFGFIDYLAKIIIVVFNFLSLVLIEITKIVMDCWSYFHSFASQPFNMVNFIYFNQVEMLKIIDYDYSLQVVSSTFIKNFRLAIIIFMVVITFEELVIIMDSLALVLIYLENNQWELSLKMVQMEIIKFKVIKLVILFWEEAVEG